MDASSEPLCLYERDNKPLCDRYQRPLPTKQCSPRSSSTCCQREPSRINTQISSKRLSVSISATLACFIMFHIANNSSLNHVHSLKNRYGTITVISAKPCQNALGQFGTCMFMWDCIKSEGVHLGTCSDRFLFGSCCYHNSTISLALVDSSNQRVNSSGSQVIHATLSNQSASFSHTDDEPHSRPHTSDHHSTPMTTIASSQLPSTQTIPSGNQASSFKPDRLFLSSHSSSGGSLDYVTTSSAPSNSSSTSDHVVNLIYDLPSNQASNTSTRDQPSSNKIYSPSLANNDWTSSAEIGMEPAIMSTTSTTTTTTTSTTTTPAPISHQQPSGQSSHWHQLQLNYTTTQPPPPVNTNSGSTYLQPTLAVQGDPNQVMAYQLVPRPPSPPPSQITTTRPVSSPSPSDANQTQRPQQGVSSWLSRPSLLANAIFHSFKPYLNPNRHRPTYRPYMGGGFRPQHQPQRPMAIQQQQQKPLLFLPASINNGNQQPQLSSDPTINSIQSNESKITSDGFMGSQTSANSTLFGSSPVNQQDNSDHHIVNPSTMTDRRRPIDQNNQQQNSLLSSMQSGDLMSQTSINNNSMIVNQNGDGNGDDQRKQQSIAHYEMVNNQGHGMTTDSASNSTRVPSGENSQLSNTTATSSLVSDTGDYLLVSNTNTSVNSLGNRPSTSTTTTSTALIPQAGLVYGYNSSSSHYSEYSGANHSLGNYQHHAANQGHHHSSNESVPSPSYPLINSGFVGTPPVLDGGPIDEIHGLMLGNIDEPPPPSSPRPSQAASGGGAPLDIQTTTQSSSLQSVGSAPPPPEITTACTTTAAPVTTAPATIPSRLNHHHQQQHHHHQLASSVPASGKEATCGVTALYPQTKVVGGKNAAFGAWPWQVSVRKVSFFGFSSTHRCGGAVISSEWIATAGHCVEDLALQSIRIRVGEYDFSTMAEPYPHIERGARKKVVHPKYNFYTYENDLALVQLDQPLQFSPHVAPICLPPDNIDLVGRNATVTGWGRLNEGGTLPTILQEVIVPIVSNDKCRDMFLRAGRPEYIPDIFLCAGYEEGGRDSCQGDSGGPLQVRGDDGRWVLAGIISWGIGCAEPLLVGVCSAIQRFKPWIQSTISSATTTS